MTQHMRRTCKCAEHVGRSIPEIVCLPEKARVSELHCDRICFESGLNTRPSRRKFLVICDNILQAFAWIVWFLITSWPPPSRSLPVRLFVSGIIGAYQDCCDL